MRHILSIDGGGIKGVFPAAFLAELELALSEPVAPYFDLIAGTSTGGIIALALGLGYSAQEILAFYEEFGRIVFPGTRVMRGLRRIRRAKYSAAPLRAALAAQFGDRRLGESANRLIIPSFDLEQGVVHIYKTAHHPKLEIDYKCPVVEVALATAAAPTFFPVHVSMAGLPLVDGGMWANNPVGVAVTEAIGMLGWPAGELRVLSLGCTESPLNLTFRRRFDGGLLSWGLRIADVFMAAQSSGALGTAYVIAGHEHVKRISPKVATGRFSLDATRDIFALRGLGRSQARYELPNLRPMFFGQHADPFQPCRTL